jgi:hypothetical protein
MTGNSKREVLSRKDALTHIDSLLADVPEGKRHGVLAWALWGLPPWSSLSDYAKVMHDVLWGRYSDRLADDLGHAAVAHLAIARTLGVDRNYGLASDLLTRSKETTLMAGKPALSRLHEALVVRVSLQTGDIEHAQQLIDGGALAGWEQDPAEFQAEILLSLAMGALLRGDLRQAAEYFDSAATKGSEHAREDLGSWQVARAMAGHAQVAFRGGFAEPASELSAWTMRLAGDYESVSEHTEATFLYAASRLLAGIRPDTKETANAVSRALLLENRGGATDLLFGINVDLGGCADADTVVQRLLLGYDANMDVQDYAGALLMGFAVASILTSLEGDKEIIWLFDRLGKIHWPHPFQDAVGRARRALESP